MASSSSSSLVLLDPPELLRFNLDVKDSKVNLKITNISNDYLVFKVKTTQPSWYFVRPNQQVLEKGKEETVVVVLVEEERRDLLKDRQKLKNEKHRFLVESKVISEKQFKYINSLQSNEKNSEFVNIWNDGRSDEKKSIKLKVDFEYPAPVAPLSKTVEYSKNSPEAAEVQGENQTFETFDVQKDLANLKKKYHDLVDYTAHLTADRDTLVAHLNEAKEQNKNLSKEKARNNRNSSGVKSEKKPEGGGRFDLIFVILIAFLAFIAGRYSV